MVVSITETCLSGERRLRILGRDLDQAADGVAAEERTLWSFEYLYLSNIVLSIGSGCIQRGSTHD